MKWSDLLFAHDLYIIASAKGLPVKYKYYRGFLVGFDLECDRMPKDPFYIAAVLIISRDDTLVYHVVTNCGTSVFCPAKGSLLPSMVMKFLERYQSNYVRLAEDVSAFYKSVDLFK